MNLLLDENYVKATGMTYEEILKEAKKIFC